MRTSGSADMHLARAPSVTPGSGKRHTGPRDPGAGVTGGTNSGSGQGDLGGGEEGVVRLGSADGDADAVTREGADDHAPALARLGERRRLVAEGHPDEVGL